MLYTPPTGGAANDPYVGKNVAAGIQGSKVPPGAVEFPQREIVAVIAAAAQTPTNSDTSQLLKAVRSGVLDYYVDTGTADALVITPNPVFAAIVDGTTFAVAKGTSPNATATPTLAVNAVTAMTIVKEDGTALAPGDLPGSSLVTLRALGGQLRVVGLRKSDAAIPASALWHFASDSSTDASRIVASGMYPPAPATRASAAYMIYAGHTCTGATQVDVGFGLGPLVRTDGNPLRAGDYVAGQPLIMIDDGYSRYQVVDLTIAQIVALLRTARYVVDSGTADALVVTPNPPITQLVDGQELIVKRPAGSSNLTTTPTIMVSGLSAAAVVQRDASLLAAGDLGGNTVTPMVYDSAIPAFRLTTFARSQVKQKLRGALPIFLRSDGSDSNDGLANSAGRAFQTLAGAWAAIFNLFDLNGFPVTFTLATSSDFTGGVNFLGSGSTIAINAASGVTANITDAGAGYCVATSGPTVGVTGVGLKYGYNGSALATECCGLARTGGILSLNGCTLNLLNSRSAFIDVLSDNSQISLTGTTTLASTASRKGVISAINGGSLNASGTVALGASFAVATGFAMSQLQARMSLNLAFSGAGTVTGPKFLASNLSILNTNSGGNVNVLPGSTAGSTDATSVYN